MILTQSPSQCGAKPSLQKLAFLSTPETHSRLQCGGLAFSLPVESSIRVSWSFLPCKGAAETPAPSNPVAPFAAGRRGLWKLRSHGRAHRRGPEGPRPQGRA